MLENEVVDNLENGAMFSLPTQPTAYFLRADQEFVYFLNYHDIESQVYRYFFCQYAKLL